MNRTLSARVESPGRPSPTASLRILIMGSPEILAGNTPLNLNHLKAQAVLYYLAASGEAFTREHVATLLWSEAGSSEALHSLRSSLYHLRQVLRAAGMEGVLVSEGEVLSLQPGRFECDLLQFRRLLKQSEETALVEAVRLYRGPLLEGFSMGEAPAFDQWLQGEEARLSQSCLKALNQLAEWAEGRSDRASLLEYLQQLALMDPWNEEVQQRLIRAYLQQGEVGPALRQYRHFENQLRQELHLEPSIKTRELLHEALRQQRQPDSSEEVRSREGVHPPASLPMIGRNHLLDRLNVIARGVQAGAGATVLIEGEAGIGKSRLIEEFAGSLVSGASPWTVLQGACSPFDDLLSYGPFLEALQNATSGDLPVLPAELDPSLPDTRGRFSWRVLQAIRSLTHSQPLLLIIEDLQWANSPTLNLFGSLSMRLQHLPALLIGSVQHADSIPALQRLISLGRRRGDLDVMPLAPLTLEGVSALLRATGLEAGSIEDLAEWLYVRSTGSPFLLNEILAQLRQENLLLREGEGWHLDAVRWWHWRSSFELPETTHDLVAWRLANLPAEALHLLDILAVAGQPLPASLLAGFPGVPPERYSMLVDDLAARRLIIEPPGGKIGLPHHLLRETLLHRLSNLHRRTLHRQLAEALEAHMSWEDKNTLLQFAMHAVAGEDIGRARRYGMAMLAELPQDYTGAETVDFVQHLHDLLAPSASASEMATLTHALGSLHQSLGQLEQGSQWLTNSLDWARQANDAAAQAEAHFEMSELALVANDYQKAMQAAEAGLTEIGSTAGKNTTEPAKILPLIGRGRRLLGAAFAMEGSDLAAAESHLQEAVTALRQSDNQGDLCAGLFELGNIAAQRGDLQAALDFYDEAAHTAEAGHIHYYLALARNNYAYHSLLIGQIEAAEKAVTQGMKAAEAHDLLAALLHLYSTRGEIHLYLAEWKQAEDAFQRGLAIAEDLGSLERKAGYLGGLALAARGRGDLTEAARLLKEALFKISEAGYWHLHTRLQIWLAETYFLQERYSEATESIELAASIAREHHRMLLLVQCETLQAGLFAVKGNWPAAEGLFAETLERAGSLTMPLETARVQAAWGRAARRYSPDPNQGAALLGSARSVFEAMQARADLIDLP